MLSALERPDRPGATLRWSARVAVGLAHLLALMPPRRIQAVLGLLRRGARPAGYAETERARDAVLYVSLACLNTEGCLPRSLATALLCRAWGTWPTWCVGPRLYPPIAVHAWVEADGRPVGELFQEGYFAKLITVTPVNRPG
ncbi:lasso peptide biosynthesis B2 protein [Allorhizocola rhizosphaerae]|uniref:lasso peptide biosynthesis B2 protein n=1 Tax=Allorhizocola rhizosphaerae TaxID=1872709 RepID=UPI000E3EA76B|nr:lasso peptide biosynthesis B2 protein [Allorhizocola rhizosphaerae]